MNKNLNILICPLEWGLGHAGRMIPLACKLRDMNNRIFIGAGEEHLSFFKTEVSGLSCIDFPGFSPGYSRFIPQYLILFLKTPLLIYFIIRDHFRLKRLIHDYSIDMVISDNRFGLWNKKITSVYVTHMPLIPFPKALRLFEKTGILLHRQIIKKYTFCFVPDLPGELNISGRLSHGLKLPENARYIGILSRFTDDTVAVQRNSGKYLHNTVILSGPEPQRSILKKKVISVFKESKLPAVILEGRPGKPAEVYKNGNLTFYSHLPASEMKEMITRSRSIITRSGYSTIMELISLNRSALLIPTPGQTEQEYLAEYLAEKGWFKTVSQKNLKIDFPLPETNAIWSDEIITRSRKLLDEALTDLSEQCYKKT
ncbi:MAG TPA: glycosyltransferase [Bacteroidales bacterium]|nr:glycosyltransferase [Bacteroidales bacterium]